MREWLTSLFEEVNKVTVSVVHSVFSAAMAMLEEQHVECLKVSVEDLIEALIMKAL